MTDSAYAKEEEVLGVLDAKQKDWAKQRFLHNLKPTESHSSKMTVRPCLTFALCHRQGQLKSCHLHDDRRLSAPLWVPETPLRPYRRLLRQQQLKPQAPAPPLSPSSRIGRRPPLLSVHRPS